MVDILEFIKREPVMFTANVYEDIAINAAPRKYPARKDYNKLVAEIEAWRFQSAINSIDNNFEPYFKFEEHTNLLEIARINPRKFKSKKINREGALIMFEKQFGKDTNTYTEFAKK